MNFESIFKKENFWLWFLLISGFLMRILYIFCFTKPDEYLWSDAGGYDGRALQMAQGKHVLFSTYWPPFFHIFLSIIYRFLLWLGLESFRIKIDIIIFGLFYVIGFWCIYQISKKLFSIKTALIILAILTFWWPFIFLNALVMSENLFFPLFFLGFYFLIKNPDKASTGIWVGLFWGLSAITRPIFILVIPIFLIWSLWYKINWKFLLIFTITITIIILSIMIYNFFYTSIDTFSSGIEKSISSNGGVGFAMLWCDAKAIQFNKYGYQFGFGPPANIDYLESKRIFTNIQFTNQKYYYQLGFSCIKQHPERLLTNFFSIIKIFDSRLFPGLDKIFGWEFFRLIFKFLNLTLFLVSIITFWFLTQNKIQIKMEKKKYFNLLFFIVMTLPITVYLQNVGEERYIIPYVPLLIILSIPMIKKLQTEIIKLCKQFQL